MRYTVTAVVCVIIAALCLAYVFTYDAAPAPAPSTSFNEGFADSKRDDCDQGFAPACAWLASRPAL
jgi:hypothetical protein